MIKKFLIWLLFGLNFVVITAFWWQRNAAMWGMGGTSTLLVYAKLAGLYAVYFVLLQFVLMGRAVWIEQVFGLDRLARLHRINGYLSLLFILLHPVLLGLAYARMGQIGFWQEIGQMVTSSDDLFQALVSVIIFCAIVFLSIYIVRKHLKYEMWYYVHLLTYAAVILAFGHQLELGSDFEENQIFTAYWYALYFVVFANLMYSRFVVPLVLFSRYKFYVSKVVPETADTVSIYMKGNGLERLTIKPGQFIKVRFLAKGFWYESHPFTLSAVAKGDFLRVTVKQLGDFTAKLSTLPVGTKVFIEGPYGVFTIPKTECGKQLLIAGGVGITPMRALLEEHSVCENCKQNCDMVLIYGNRKMSDVLFKKDFDEYALKRHIKVHYVISDEPDFEGEKGRIDQEKLLRLVPDIREREVFLCGPPPMMKGLRSMLSGPEFSLPAKAVHYELFSF